MNLHEVEKLADLLMARHGLDEEGWSFEFDRAKRRFGQCRHQDKAISLSEHLTRLNAREKVKDTILHEIAHALAGPGVGHDPRWRQIAAEIGAWPERCYPHSVETPECEFQWLCPSCGAKGRAHRRDVRWCSSCADLQGHVEDTRLIWFRNGELLAGPFLGMCSNCDATYLRYSEPDGRRCRCGGSFEWVGPISEESRLENCFFKRPESLD
jgi:predicted SprT family Zn-dependent metalloprotease